MELVIGGAQLGLNYGITNGLPQSKKRSFEILETALSNGFNAVDVAMNYGESHNVIREFNKKSFKIHTKIAFDLSRLNNGQSPISMFEDVIKQLGREKIHLLYLHNPEILDSKYAITILKTLQGLKDEGRVDKLGVSIYDSATSIPAIFDVIQMPLNIFSLQDYLVIRQNYRDKEINVRSIFLQGLLTGVNVPEKFNHFGLQNWFLELKRKSILPYEFCVHFAKYMNPNGIIVGFTTSKEVQQFINAYKNDNFDITKMIHDKQWQSLITGDISYLKDPRKWD